jgi:hypothetical protein
MSPFGSSEVHHFCGACGKPCELVEATDTKPELTDDEWAEQFCDKVKIAADFGMDPLSVIFAADGMPLTIKNTLLIGLAEGRRRQKLEQGQAHIAITLDKRLTDPEIRDEIRKIMSVDIAQREEAAAREAWVNSRIALSGEVHFYTFEDWWERRQKQ